MSHALSPILQAAKEHFSGFKRGELNVPEWGNAVITWSPLTLAERRKIYATMDDGRHPDGATVFLRTLILKACDEAGEKIFTKMDENQINHGVDPTVVTRIATEILNFGSHASSTEDELESAKN